MAALRKLELSRGRVAAARAKLCIVRPHSTGSRPRRILDLVAGSPEKDVTQESARSARSRSVKSSSRKKLGPVSTIESGYHRRAARRWRPLPIAQHERKTWPASASPGRTMRIEAGDRAERRHRREPQHARAHRAPIRVAIQSPARLLQSLNSAPMMKARPRVDTDVPAIVCAAPCRRSQVRCALRAFSQA